MRAREAALDAEATELKHERHKVECEAVSQRRWHEEYVGRARSLAARDVARVVVAAQQLRLRSVLVEWRAALPMLKVTCKSADLTSHTLTTHRHARLVRS